jgi:hypothetical protein
MYMYMLILSLLELGKEYSRRGRGGFALCGGSGRVMLTDNIL